MEYNVLTINKLYNLNCYVIVVCILYVHFQQNQSYEDIASFPEGERL